jgi:purine nucleoside permease
MGQITAMPRPIFALLVGLLGFALYIGAVVALADHVLPLHWLVQAAYFLVAGIAWVPPARALMFWAARHGS